MLTPTVGSSPIPKKDRKLVEYINTTRVHEKDLDNFISSRKQLIRFYEIIQTLKNDEKINDVTLQTERGDSRMTRSKRAFISLLMSRGHMLSNEVSLIQELEACGDDLHRSCVNQYQLKELLSTDNYSMKAGMLTKFTQYYCPKYVADHIDDHAAHLGFTKETMAVYYILLAVSDFSFSAHTDKDLADLLESLNIHLSRRLEDVKRQCCNFGMDFPNPT